MNVAAHQLHAHRYAHSQHAEESSSDDLRIVSRNKATSCEHKFVHVAASHEETMTTESSANLISHLEEQSSTWIAQFSAKVNGEQGGLTQKFIFNLTQPTAGDARSDPTTAISILEKFGS